MDVDTSNYSTNDLNAFDRAFIAFANKFTPIENGYKQYVPKAVRYVLYPFIITIAILFCLACYMISASIDVVLFMLNYFK